MGDRLRALLIAVIFTALPFHAYATSGTVPTTEPSRLVVDMGEQCVISIKDYFEGHLASGMPLNASYWTDKPPVKTSKSKFGVNFVCVNLIDKSQEEIARQYGAVYDSNNKKWIPYFENRRDVKLLEAVTKVHKLDTVNGSGFYLIQDDRDGDPARRERYLSFCIFHDSKAVCGGEPIMNLSDPRGNILPCVLTILRSVQFIGTSASRPESASIPVAH